jgi:hypothetical protein
MSCPKTEHLLREYFADDLNPLAKSEMERHLTECEFCNSELDSLLLVQSDLQRWQNQQAPHWDRGVELFRREHRHSEAKPPLFRLWQWLPTGVSFAMLMLVVLNTNLVAGEQGVSISFGSATTASANLDKQLAEFQRAQQEEFSEFMVRVENRQDLNNLQLMQAVFDQTQQTTAENLERIYAFFEEQRIQDLEDMRVGYQELVNNDYETIRSLEQLAQFVSFNDTLR